MAVSWDRLLLPDREGHPDAGAGLGPVGRDVVHQAHRQVLGRAGRRDPVADLGVAGFELRRRQRAQRLAVLLGEQVEDVAVQLLVHEEVAEPARGHDGHALARRPGLDRLPDGPPELVAALRSRLVRRVVRVEQHRHDGHHAIAHEPLVHEAPRVAEGAVARLHADVGDVEVEVVRERSRPGAGRGPRPRGMSGSRRRRRGPSRRAGAAAARSRPAAAGSRRTRPSRCRAPADCPG